MGELPRSAVGILGTGRYVPTKVITNADVEQASGIPAREITEKTGIETRYIVENGQSASAISAIAAREAIAAAGIDPSQIDLVVACTFSGDYIYPAMSVKVAELVGAHRAGAYDVMANCTGFQVGLTTVADRLKADPALRYGLVLGTAVQSPYLDPTDPETAMFFGDGAGAAIVGPVPDSYGILASHTISNGKVYEAVRLRGGGSSHPLRPENINQGLQYYEMNGMEVWKQVIQHQPKVVRESLEKIGAKVEDVDLFIFHQANLRLIEYLMGKMKLPMTRTHTNVAQIGNTADASLAITLCDAVSAGKLKRGDLVVLSGVGAGFIFGSLVLRWY